MTTGLWLAIACASFAVVFFLMFRFYLLYCSYYAWTWCMPLACLSALLAFAFSLLTAWGYFAYIRQSKDHRSELSLCLAPRSALDSTEMASFHELPLESPSEIHGQVNDGALGTSGAAGAATLSPRSKQYLRQRYDTMDVVGHASSGLGQTFHRRLRRAEHIRRGWRSVDQLLRQTFKSGDEDDEEEMPYAPFLDWDQGACCGLQCCCASSVLAILFLLLGIAATLGDSYFYLQSVFDWKWGFALQEGYPYTAPVWMGEFGQNTRGRYWMHLLNYMSVRDVDFAYWTFNGLKLSSGFYDPAGHYQPYDTPTWEDETFGILQQDYHTIRHPWKLLDLRAVMTSPSGWVADDYPCDRAVLGNACGG